MRESLVFLPATILYLALKSALFPKVPLPDLSLLVIFYLAYRKAGIDGALLAFVLGYIEDSFSAGVVGSSSFALLLIFILVHLGAKKVHFSTPFIRAAGAGTAALLKGAAIYSILRFSDYEPSFLWSVVFQAVVTGIFAPALFTLFTRLSDRISPHSFRDNVN